MKDKKIKEMVYTSLFAALVCVATFIIKIPTPATNGYVHLGDGLIFISVLLLGRKNGAWAGSIGAALADILGGYSFYAIPTFIIKWIMAYCMGVVIEKLPDRFKYKWVAGAVLGSIWQVIGYYITGSVMVGSFISTISEIPANIIQSAVGIISAAAFMAVFKQTPLGKETTEC
jgi:uncharacterized membrane protein